MLKMSGERLRGNAQGICKTNETVLFGNALMLRLWTPTAQCDGYLSSTSKLVQTQSSCSAMELQNLPSWMKTYSLFIFFSLSSLSRVYKERSLVSRYTLFYRLFLLLRSFPHLNTRIRIYHCLFLRPLPV